VLDGGKLAQMGTAAEIFDRPADAFVARFIGRVNEMAAHVDGKDGRAALRLADGREIPRPPSLPAGAEKVTVMIRPHLIEVAGPGTWADAHLSGVVRRRTFIGDVVEIGIDSGGLVLTAEARPGRDAAADLAVGSPVELRWRPQDTLVFAP
jgi:putative spermidine/putrescine transport system ATP-binding protein